MAFRGRLVNLRRVLVQTSNIRPSRGRIFCASKPIQIARDDDVLHGRQMSSSPSARLKKIDAPFFKPSLVIFDKDGTLVCFHTMWTPWCTSLAARIHEATGIDMTNDVYEMLGYDDGQKKVKMGVLAENTHTQIKDKLSELLRSHPELCPVLAEKAVEKSWQDTPENMQIKTTGNLYSLFRRLKSHDVKIAICTSDSRDGTLQFLNRERLSGLVDMVVCGDDPYSKPKPDPHNALHICKTLGVEPSKTIMVGDTPADTLMGQEAKLGLTVGVLTGIGNQHELADADVIVLDVNECVDMILPSISKPDNTKTVYHVTTRGISKIAMGSMLLQNSENPFARSGSRHFSTSATVTAQKSGFSHIVIGAGSAGCVLSNRISGERQTT